MAKQQRDAPFEISSAVAAALDALPACSGIYAAVHDSRGMIVDFRILYVNEAACRNNRLSRDEQIGQRLNDLMPGHRDTGLFGAYCQVVDTGRPFVRERFGYTDLFGDRVESRVFRINVGKLGDGFIATWEMLPDQEAQGDEKGDVEPAVFGPSGSSCPSGSGEESLVRRALDSIFAFVGILAPDGTLLDANAAPLAAAGIAKREAVGKRFWDCSWWNYSQKVQDELRGAVEAAARGRTVRYEVPVRIAGDSRIWIDFQIAPIRGPGGGVTHLIATAADITARKAAEAELELRASQHRRALALESVGIGMWELEIETDRFTWDALCHTIYGVPEGHFEGTAGAFDRLVHPEDRVRVWAAVKRAAEGGTTSAWDFRIVRPDGQVRWVSNLGRALRDDRGQVFRMVGTITDITDQKRFEAAQQESKERLQFALAAGKAGTWDLDLVTGRAVWSESHFTLLGLAPAPNLEATETMWWSAVVEEDLPRLMAEWDRAARERDLFHSEHRMRGAESTGVMWARAVGRFSYDQAGCPVRFSGVFFDISERKRAEAEEQAVTAALKESEVRFRSMADGIPLPLWVHAPGGELEFVNATFCEYFGVTKEEVRGERWRLLTHPDDGDAYSNEFFACARERRPFHGQVRVRRSDGQWRWFESWGQPRFSGSGEFLGMAGASADVTDRRAAEEELHQHREHLQRLVDERTAELETSYKRLRFSERLASIGTLAAGLGHDMGNILMPLQVRLETLETLALPAEAASELEGIRTLVEYLRRLASGLRLLALDPHTVAGGEATAIGSWWAETEAVFRTTLPRGITLTSDLGSCADSTVAMARSSLTQAVFNLVQNAGDAMRSRGHGTVTVSGRCEDGQVLLSISDTGPGMTAEVRRRCMEPFFTTKSRGISTGLGLSLVYGFVQEAGGTVNLESEPDKGATFTLSVPMTQLASVARPGSGKRVYLEIENPRVRGYVTAELRNLDYEVRIGTAEAAEDDPIVTEKAPPPDRKGRVVVLENIARLSEVRAQLHLAFGGEGTWRKGGTAPGEDTRA